MAKRGDRIKLIRSTDEYTHLRPGALGTVVMVDDLNTVHVKWDSGSSLGLIQGADRWKIVKGGENE